MARTKLNSCRYCKRVASFPLFNIIQSLSTQMTIHPHLKKFDSCFDRILISTLFASSTKVLNELLFHGKTTITLFTILIHLSIAILLEVNFFEKIISESHWIKNICCCVTCLKKSTGMVSTYITRVKEGYPQILCFLNALFDGYGKGIYSTILRTFFTIPIQKKKRFFYPELTNGILFLFIFSSYYFEMSRFCIELSTILFAIELISNKLISRYFGFSFIDSLF